MGRVKPWKLFAGNLFVEALERGGDNVTSRDSIASVLYRRSLEVAFSDREYFFFPRAFSSHL
jgi:hypothetical protein